MRQTLSVSPIPASTHYVLLIGIFMTAANLGGCGSLFRV